jgi:predicted dehydrogenase
MHSVSRRKFLFASSLAAASLPLRASNLISANNRVRIGLIGCGRRSFALVRQFAFVPDCQIVALCDPDTAQVDTLLKKLTQKQVPGDFSGVDRYQDYRRLLERDDIDAVVVATPNHWHALHAIHAMQAGKDVYLEKPVTHNVWEGQQLVAAAKASGRVIAAGFQNRSDPAPIEGIRYVHEGNLGKIESVHVCCFRNRDSIGPRRAQPLLPPSTCDYNLWLGPAQDEPILRNNFHYDWHWVWNNGNGDIGNQAPHEIDMACWVMGGEKLPTSMDSFGNRFAWNDAGETPNLHTAWFEQNTIPCIIEVNDLKLSPERNVAGARHGTRVGIIVRCEGGELRGGRGGMYVVGDDGKTRLTKFPGDGGKLHQQNFIDAVRSRRSQDLSVSIERAELSSAVAHLANVSLRTGTNARESALLPKLSSHPVLQRILQDQSKQLKNWGIDDPEYRVGQSLQIDPLRVSVKGESVAPLVRPVCRPEFTVPELV